MIKNKTLNYKCYNCIEERKKADQSRKYAHELKNIFITISTVVNSEIEFPTLTATQSSIQNSTNPTNNTLILDSGDVSPFIFETRKPRNAPKRNSNASINPDSPFLFL